MRKISVLARLLAVFVVLSASAALLRADCVYFYDQDPVCDPPAAVYYATLTSEPDWCAYSANDVVFGERTLVGGTYQTTAWYVVRAADTANQSLGSSPFEVFAYGRVDGCDVHWLI